MEFRVLGQIEALEGDERLKVAAGRQLALDRLPGASRSACSGASALGIRPRIGAGWVVDSSARRIERWCAGR